MVKKWIDANLIAEVTDIPKKLHQYDDLMKEIPNHKKQGARKIFERKEYSIYKVSNGYVIHNINKEFIKGHTHVRSFIKAKSIIDLCVRKKLPNTPKKWEIQSLIRITNDKTYINKLKDLLKGLK